MYSDCRRHKQSYYTYSNIHFRIQTYPAAVIKYRYGLTLSVRPIRRSMLLDYRLSVHMVGCVVVEKQTGIENCKLVTNWSVRPRGMAFSVSVGSYIRRF